MDYNSGVSVRVKRGMVFWYDNNGGGDKTDVTVEVLGKKKISRVIAGKRPWVVVSSDEMNENSSTCNIIPMTTTDKEDDKFVQFIYNGRIQTVLTNQGTTVDSFVLREYECFLTDTIMDKIQEGIMRQFGIKSNKEVYKEERLEVKESNQISMELEGVKPVEVKKVDIKEVKPVEIKKVDIKEVKPVEIKKVDIKEVKEVKPVEVKKVEVKEIEDTKIPSAVDKFNKKYANYFNGKENGAVVQVSGKRNDWDKEKAKKFLREYNSGVDKKKMVKKYNMKNVVSLYNLKANLEKMLREQDNGRNTWDENRAKQLIEDVGNLGNEQVLEKYGFKNKNSMHNAKSRLTKRYNLGG